MARLITKGFGGSTAPVVDPRVVGVLRTGIVSQGFGGLVENVIDLSRQLVIGGRSTTNRIKEKVRDVVVRVTLLSVEDRYLGLNGIEKSTIDHDAPRQRIMTTYIGKRLIERIRLDVKQVK